MLELITQGITPSGGGIPRSYSEFVVYAQTHCSEQLTSDQALSSAGPKMYIATTLRPAAPGTTTMYGSPFTDAVSYNASMYNISCHASPTISVWYDLSGSNRVVLLHTGSLIERTGGWIGITRNGFTSQSYARKASGYPIDDFIYWDTTLGKVMRCNPSKQEVVGTLFDGILRT